MALGAGSLSGIGSILNTKSEAIARSSAFKSNELCDNLTPLAFTVNVPLFTGLPFTTIQPSYCSLADEEARLVILNFSVPFLDVEAGLKSLSFYMP